VDHPANPGGKIRSGVPQMDLGAMMPLLFGMLELGAY
jgi:hypothetical protein